MSVSPSKILLRLQELKLWQENQELKIMQKKTATAASPNDSESMRSDNEKPPSTWDCKQITPTKSFDRLLEEQLARDPGPPSLKMHAATITPQQRRPFLRKGAGLKRYGGARAIRRPQTHKNNNNFSPLKVPQTLDVITATAQSKATWTCDIEPNNNNTTGGDQELRLFEALEERADNSSFCSTNSSIIQLLLGASTNNNSCTPQITTLNKHRRQQLSRVIEEEQTNNNDLISDEDDSTGVVGNGDHRGRRHVHWTDQDSWSTRSENSSDDDGGGSVATTTSSSSSSITSSDLLLHSTLIEDDDNDLGNETVTECRQRDIGVNTINNNTNEEICDNCGSKLHEIIVKYDNEIDIIKTEKQQIINLRRELQRKLEEIDRNERKRHQEWDDEKVRLLHELDVEKKRLSKERMVFETYVKDVQNRPNKKEREELANLRKELVDVKELLKLKESKNGVTQARLRTQNKQLDKDNGRLKDEIGKLSKENAKLLAAQKCHQQQQRRSSDTKMLHEINKNLTKLTQDNTANNVNNKSIDKKGTKKKENNPPPKGEDFINDSGKSPKNIGQEYHHTIVSDNNETKKTPERIEEILDNGTKLIRYSNGNIKTISVDGNFIVMKYYNGDIKQTNLTDGLIKYFYNDKSVWHTNYSNGSELIEYPNGSVERKHPDGKCEIVFEDGVTKTTYPDGIEEIRYLDGSVLNVLNGNDNRILFLANGQKEIHTKNDKRREYPDGTVKILYPDGSQETRYATGRVRIKDAHGNLIMDTDNNSAST